MKTRKHKNAENMIIRGGRVIDPAAGLDEIKEIKIEGGLIVESFSGEREAREIEAEGLVVAPGLIDMHVHLREPGREDEETISSGAAAAAAGGFTAICCMPNTEPPVDSLSVVEYIKDKAARAPIDIGIVGAISLGLIGKRLAPLAELAEAGVVGFSDDGRPVTDSALMRRAMEYGHIFGLPLISHAEDLRLANNGSMHEGPAATELGLKGIPGAAEEVMVARDLLLAELTGARLHITHLSSAGSVDLIRQAKARGVKVTADATPHHLVLTDEDLRGYDTNLKVNPPLRGARDRAALIEGLADGTIDAIASDHAPHAGHEKEMEFESAPCGTIGLQTTLPVLLTYLAGEELGLVELIGKLTAGPAAILGLPGGTLRVGVPADIVLIDPKAKGTVKPETFLSLSNNSAFIDRELTGHARHVIKNGEIIVENGEII